MVKCGVIILLMHAPTDTRRQVILLTGRLSGCRLDRPLCFILLCVYEWESCVCAVHADVNTSLGLKEAESCRREVIYVCVTESILYL